MPALNTPACDFGWPAPDFSLPGTDDRQHTLSSCRGPKGLLVAFICNHCPYVQAILGRLIRDAVELQGMGIGVVAISSNDTIAYPEDSFPHMKALAKAHAFPFPYLYDEHQTIARTYGAVCTPDFFGFDDALKLQYRGRLDASGRNPAPADAKRELVDAMRKVVATGQGPKEQWPSIGCSLKWKDADAQQ